jgi:hypothetical protein
MTITATHNPTITGAEVASRPKLRVIAGGKPHQQTLPLEWELPSGLPATPPVSRHLRVVPDAGTTQGAGGTRQGVSLPPPAPWVARLAPAIMEVIAGERPASQLQRWTTREIHETLTRRGAAALRHPAGRDRAAPCRTVRSVRICPVAPGVVEASAVVIGAERARAIALRLETIRGRWLVTACEVG